MWEFTNSGKSYSLSSQNWKSGIRVLLETYKGKKNILADIVGLDEKEQEENFSLFDLVVRKMSRNGKLEDVLLKEKLF